MLISEIKEKLQEFLTPKRYTHSLNVMDVSVELAEIYGINKDKAAYAGLLHDCARELKKDKIFELCEEYNINLDEITRSQPQLMHGPVGAYLAKYKYEISDEDILNSIKYHTTGRPEMSILEKIVYVADFIEPARDFPKVEIARRLAVKDIEKCTLYSLNRTIKNLVSKDGLIHPLTFSARNQMIFNILDKKTRKK